MNSCLQVTSLFEDTFNPSKDSFYLSSNKRDFPNWKVNNSEDNIIVEESEKRYLIND